MKKIIILLTITVSVQFSGFSQFRFHVFPQMMGEDPFGDTMLNTRAILLNAAVKQVNMNITSNEEIRSFSSKTVYLNANGSIDRITFSFPENKKANFALRVSDTLLYDHAGRLTSMRTTDNMGNKYPQYSISYGNEREVVHSYIGGMHPEDSSLVYEFYNEKGQLVNYRSVWNQREVQNILFYYNTDGLFDSTKAVGYGTFIFKRRKRGKLKLVEMENFLGNFTWIYNQSGQCVSSMFIDKNPPGIIRDPNYKPALKTEASYFYNPDGTLSNINIKKDGKPAFKLSYSYQK